MVCDVCKDRDAVVNLTQVHGEVTSLLRLCEQCAAERGVETLASTPKHPLGEFLHAVQQQITPVAGDAMRCAFCSFSLREFRATGRLGCAQCYSTFERSLRDLLRRVHGSSRHVGRRYEPPQPELMEHVSLLGELRDRLRRAIESEQFEVAADLRDRIKVLE